VSNIPGVVPEILKMAVLQTYSGLGLLVSHHAVLDDLDNNFRREPGFKFRVEGLGFRV